MIQLTIDKQTIEVKKGTSLLKAAQKLGIEIPAMCHNEGIEHFTSCMICLVKDKKTGKLLPSCSIAAQEGMQITTYDDEIEEARRTGLELLLSEHTGDCEAPCTIACQANMNIPQMNRLLVDGKIDDAVSLVREKIALPAVLGRICPAPCEDVCKRKPIDGAVSICLLKRYAGDHGLNNSPVRKTSINKKIAVIGSGPAGLSAAYYLQLQGADVTIYEANEQAGGNLRYAIPDEKLPKDILDKEIKHIRQTGVKFCLGQEIDKATFLNLQNENDAVVLASGDLSASQKEWNLNYKNDYLKIDKRTFQTNLPKVFAIGNITRSSRLAIRALGHGQKAASCVLEFITTGKIEGSKTKFNSRVGHLLQDEFAEYLKESENIKRHTPKSGFEIGFSLREMINEAARCLHCDCREIDNCKLRDYSDEYGAKQKRFSSEIRAMVTKNTEHNLVVFEASKCIKCGICVRLSSKKSDQLGFTFIGRGYDVEVGIPFAEKIELALKENPTEIAKACPTGAIALK